MATNKHIHIFIIAAMSVAVIICMLAVSFSDTLVDLLGGYGVSMEYESALFDTDEVIDVNIIMDEDSFNEMLSNAMSEEYYVCDVIINGERINNVAIRPKGNTSLSSIAMDPDTVRYSFKLEFGHFVEGQTFMGLDKLILNNNYADATNMKEAIIYDMFNFLDADASLTNYAKISVNGEYFGVYLALEAVEESFMLRNYGTQDGELYKPESMGMGGGDREERNDFSMPDMENMDFSKMREAFESAENSEDDTSSEESGHRSFGGFGGGGFSMGGGGANLNYIDDDLDSYSTIWEGEVTNTSDSDHRKVVAALKNISEGNDLLSYMDVDNILKYMAVHTFAVNQDSLSGTMAHNYYLYEYDGKLNIIPWDYNLSFGGMGMGRGGSGATDTINDAIDTPFDATEFFDVLLENEEYLEKYHEYLNMLVEEYVYGGRFEEVYNKYRSTIDELVATDPNAFYDYEEYETAVNVLYETVMLRAESIRGQLDGTIPSTDEEQENNATALVDASHINLSDMGSMNMGGGEGGFNFGNREMADAGDMTSGASFDLQESEEVPGAGGFDFSNMPNGEGFNPENLPDMEGFNPENAPDMSGMPERPDSDSEDSGENQERGQGRPGRGGFTPGNMPDMENFDSENMPDMGNFDSENMPDMGNFRQGNMPGAGESSATGFSITNILIYAACLAAMIAAIVIISRVKRNR